jgi:HSP20 family protein
MAEVNVAKQPKQESSLPARSYERVPLFGGSLFDVNPFALMRRFTEDMDQMFGPASRQASQISGWRPVIEVKEEKGKLRVKADLPGVEMKDVKVTAADGILTIEGERRQEMEEKREGYFHSERSYGRFSRSIPLPEGAKTDQAAAQFNNGVLEITMPVPESQLKRHEIPVQDAKARTAAG